MNTAAQLARIAAVRPDVGDVAIVLLDRGCGVWQWLCADCLVRKISEGWVVKERREPPHKLDCETCRRRTQVEGER